MKRTARCLFAAAWFVLLGSALAQAQTEKNPAILQTVATVALTDVPEERDGKATGGSSAKSAETAKVKVNREDGEEGGNQKEATKENGKEKGEGKGKEGEENKEKEEDGERYFNAFTQGTVISQWHGRFRSPYVGPNSVPPFFEWKTSETATLFLGARVWEHGELYFDPEIAGGLGFGGVTGIAGFPNGDITRVGQPQPTPYIARLYLVQTLGLGGNQEKVESGPNQLAGTRDISRLTLALGKMAATDWFDLNRYSHDPRTQFMNWALMYNGAWDYPADVRGYDFGGVVEWNEENFAVRYGLFGEPHVANGPDIDSHFSKAHGQIWELEQRYKLDERPGRVRWWFYINRAHMGNYQRALELSPVDPDITETRTYASRKYGLGMNLEQELRDDLGFFMRLGWNDGHTESWAFTEIDRTWALGLAQKGIRWGRPDDAAGIGFALNGLSPEHRDYLAAGGLGFILGDGRLNYRPEAALEIYYALQLKKGVVITPDFQLVGNPGFNHDRGPVAIGTVRVHAEF
jgi:high affinity Mn2+ porin